VFIALLRLGGDTRSAAPRGRTLGGGAIADRAPSKSVEPLASKTFRSASLWMLRCALRYLLWAFGRISSRGPRLPPVGQSLDDDEQGRDKEDAEESRREHSGDDNGAEHPPRGGARPRRDPKRNAPEDERERGHEDGSQAEFCSLERGLDDRSAFFVLRLREFNDENGVLRREPNEHHEPDLCVYVVVEVSREQPDVGAEHGDRHAEKHAERSDQLS